MTVCWWHLLFGDCDAFVRVATPSPPVGHPVRQFGHTQRHLDHLPVDRDNPRALGGLPRSRRRRPGSGRVRFASAATALARPGIGWIGGRRGGGSRTKAFQALQPVDQPVSQQEVECPGRPFSGAAGRPPRPRSSRMLVGAARPVGHATPASSTRRRIGVSRVPRRGRQSASSPGPSGVRRRRRRGRASAPRQVEGRAVAARRTGARRRRIRWGRRSFPEEG